MSWDSRWSLSLAGTPSGEAGGGEGRGGGRGNRKQERGREGVVNEEKRDRAIHGSSSIFYFCNTSACTNIVK